jgi:hypothetical protein
MKKFLLPAGGLIAVAIGVAVAFNMYGPQQNPDPNHTHADFAVWVNGQRMDFSDQKYMSEAYEEGKEVRVDPLRKYLHLHDGNGHVVHRHKPVLTFGEFLESIGFSLSEGNGVDVACVTLPDGRTLCDANPLQGWLVLVNNAPLGCSRAWGEVVCGGPGETLLNRQSDIVDLWNYVFEDGDQILLSYGPYFEEGEEGGTPDTREMRREWELMTDDACRYSQTCPWRGAPPTENCIADPAVPCVAP